MLLEKQYIIPTPFLLYTCVFHLGLLHLYVHIKKQGIAPCFLLFIPKIEVIQ